MPYVQLKGLKFAQAGNRKQIRIADDEAGIYWIEALNEHVFRRHWLDFPTIILQFDLNIFNQNEEFLALLIKIIIRI